MSRLEWGPVGQRFFETGVDRGVLYVEGSDGVAWSGLVSVDENPDGGTPTPYYFDGEKFYIEVSDEEFNATISAFYSPPEFDQCDGMLSIAQGLYATQQKRKPFGLTYRTMIGNDIDGQDHAYKIHIVYNAVASPSNRTRQTINESTEAGTLSWDLTTKSEEVPNALPSAHLVIKSNEAYKAIVLALEDMLYGTESSPPYLPTPSEIYTLFDTYDDFTVVDNGDGTFTVTTQLDELIEYGPNDMFTLYGDSEQITVVDEDTYTLDSP